MFGRIDASIVAIDGSIVAIDGSIVAVNAFIHRVDATPAFNRDMTLALRGISAFCFLLSAFQGA
ncbi:MAG: hypothetical protein DMF56_05630 [Acidobacteria bacterium]|nr:MAG: hypothetical protein DMF56_05630 [Acidobacteriota bacterium]